MSSRAGTADETAAAHQARDPKPVDSGMRLVVQPSSVLPRSGSVDLGSPNVLKSNLLTTMKSSGLQHLPSSVMLGNTTINQTSSLFPRSAVPLVAAAHSAVLAPRTSAPVVTSKVEVTGGALCSLYRQLSPGGAINLSQAQRSTSFHTSSLANSLSSVLQTVSIPSGVAPVVVACRPGGMTFAGATMPHSAVGPARPVAVQTVPCAAMPTQIRVTHSQSQPTSVPAAMLNPRTMTQPVRMPVSEQQKSSPLVHGHVPRGAAAAAIVLATPRVGAGAAVALPRPSHLPVASAHLTSMQPYPLLSASISASSGGPLAAIASRPPVMGVAQRQQGQQTWMLPTSSVAVTSVSTIVTPTLPNKTHDGLTLPSPRPLALAVQQIRPQQLALVTQKAMLGSPSMSTAAASKATELTAINLTHANSRSTMGPTMIQTAPGHLLGHPHSSPIIGQSQAMNLSHTAAPKSQKIVLSQGPRLNVQPANAVNLSKTIMSHQSSGPLNLTQNRQAKTLKPQPSTAVVSVLSSFNVPPMALTTSRSSAGIGLSSVSSSLQAPHGMSVSSSSVARAVTVIPGHSGHHHVTPFAPQLTTLGQPPAVCSLPNQQVRLPGQNTVLFNAYGIASPHSGPSAIPVTLQPVLQTVDARHPSDRMISSQSYVTPYTAQVVSMSIGNVPRIELPLVQRSVAPPVISSLPISLLAPHCAAPCCTMSSVPRTNVPTVMSVVGSSHQMVQPVSQHYSTVIDASTRLMADVPTVQHVPQPQTIVALNFNRQPLPSRPQAALLAVPESIANIQPNMSPRPGILRKRTHETPRASVKRSLQPVLGPSSTVISTGAAPSMDSSNMLTASPKVHDGSRENSRSSTDTAASSEDSSPASSRLASLGCLATTGLKSGVRSEEVVTSAGSFRSSIPRKKPRKQSLHANEEMPPPGFTSDDEYYDTDPPPHGESRGNDWMSAAGGLADRLHYSTTQTHADLLLPDSPMLSEHVDDDGVRYTLDVPCTHPNAVSVLGSYHCSWKPRNNHFVSHSDFKIKEERRPTVNELANQKNVVQRASGWKMHALAAEFDALTEMENIVLRDVSSLRDSFLTRKTLSSTRQLAVTRTDDSMRIVNELVQGNVQRCQHYVEQLTEAKSTLLKFVEERRPHAIEIITRHQSKRAVKKKERL